MKNMMITKQTVAAVCCAVSILACSDEASPTAAEAPHHEDKSAMTFRASLDADDAGSRTSLSADGCTVTWNRGDAITVFGQNGEGRFSVASGEGSQVATFTGVTVPSPRYYAVYPSMGTCRGNVISGVTIPAIQTAVTGGFDAKANVMVATCTPSTMRLAFRHVCSFLKIDVRYPCSSIVVTAAPGDNIAGTFSVAVADDGLPSITPTSGTNTISLLPSGGDIQVGTYYIAVAPVTVNSLEVKCYGTDGITARKTKLSATTIARKNVMNLGTVLRKNGWKEYPDPYNNGLYESFAIDMGDAFSVYWLKSNADPNAFGSLTFNSSETFLGTLFRLSDVLDVSKDGFRLPSQSEFYELYTGDNTHGYSETRDGVKGLTYYSKQYETKPVRTADDVHVFLPCAGWQWKDDAPSAEVNHVGMYGFYWVNDQNGNALQTTYQDDGSNFTYFSSAWSGMSAYPNKDFMKYSVRLVFPKRDE